ncbi:hypothetical protein COC42_04340 [Sphingomonas spermidinifaciens]|uniref:L,D-transpeptidase n=1 Tax=Sphingomonas spermidinifaciens TaxID=1141889 RepID=A0A2A4B691_9SPHN|nr:hypothetical protein [Sphingomonas spermidinifaciens]PCD03600.1 hypothetical protein COC42_04340 [Sphingomonas spermidinifaciens]
MKTLILPLLALALISPAAAQTKKKPRPKPKPPVATKVEVPILPSADVARVAAWVAGSGDNRTLPYTIIDKNNAALFMFDGKGKQVAAVPVLIGIMAGDDASPGVGSKKLSDLGPAEKTTPAGRYLAKFGLPVAGERVLWVDYSTSVALHPIPADAAAKEKRRARILSPTSDDNRITFGCINVPRAFYAKQLRPGFRRKGGYVYILPDTKPIETVFPRLRTVPPVG